MKRKMGAMLLGLLLLTGLCACRETDSRDESLVQIQEEAWILSDGTKVSLWRSENSLFSDDLYCLPDQTVLLTLSVPAMPELDGLESTARDAIHRYYGEQGPLYDLGQELENAFEEYSSCRKAGKEYPGRSLGQEILLCGENEQILCCMTQLRRPLRGRIGVETRKMTAFDRETGEPIDPRMLFRLPEQEVIRRLTELAGVQDPSEADAMVEAFSAQMVLLSSGYLAVEFPPGSLPGQENPQILVVDDWDALEGLLQPWAVLRQPEETDA